MNYSEKAEAIHAVLSDEAIDKFLADQPAPLELPTPDAVDDVTLGRSFGEAYRDKIVAGYSATSGEGDLSAELRFMD